MRVIKLLLTVLAASSGLSSCVVPGGPADVSGEIVETRHRRGPVSSIRASSGVVVVISTEDTGDTIIVKGPKNVVDALELQYDGVGRLSAYMRRGEMFRYRSESQRAHIYVSSDHILHLECSSGAEIEVSYTLRCNGTLSAEAMSGGQISLARVESPRVSARSLTGGSIVLGDIVSERVDAQSYTGGVVSISGVTREAYIRGDRHLVITDNLKIIN